MTPLELAQKTRKTIQFTHEDNIFYLREPDFDQLQMFSVLPDEDKTQSKHLASLIRGLWVDAEGVPVDATEEAICTLPARFVIAISQKLQELVNITERIEEAAKN